VVEKEKKLSQMINQLSALRKQLLSSKVSFARSLSKPSKTREQPPPTGYDFQENEAKVNARSFYKQQQQQLELQRRQQEQVRFVSLVPFIKPFCC